jgi:hypothetical protein
MSTSTIRTIRRSSTCADARPNNHGSTLAARPFPAPSVLGVALGPIIFALGILRPVYRKAIANQPFAEIGPRDQTRCHGASVLIKRGRDAGHRPSRNEGIEFVRCLGAAAILQTVLTPAELRAGLRRTKRESTARRLSDMHRLSVIEPYSDHVQF